nr:MAG TPA_asm: hypothetical protein [Caudoviricetes sp.]
MVTRIAPAVLLFCKQSGRRTPNGNAKTEKL